MMTLALIVIALLTIGLAVLMVRDLAKSERLDAFIREKQRITAQETRPPEPVFQMRSNADGQFSMFHDPPASSSTQRWIVTFSCPWNMTREESRNLAVDILSHQGAEGIAAAKTLIGEDSEK
jgi:hypothetical protein